MLPLEGILWIWIAGWNATSKLTRKRPPYWFRRSAPLCCDSSGAKSSAANKADDLLQDTWLRIHRVRHTYRPGEPVLPWIYAIARRVRVDGYRKTRRISMHETTMDVLPERPAQCEPGNTLHVFETLVAALPKAQREVITMLKVGGLSLEEVARAKSSTVGAAKQKAHRAYSRLRKALHAYAAGGVR